MKHILPAVVLSLWSTTALGHTIGIFADPLGTDCNLVIPYPGGAVTAYVVASIDPDTDPGMVAARFRIGGLPAGWNGSRTGVDPGANVVLGDPFADGVILAYPSEVVGHRVLVTLSITPTTLEQNVGLFVLPHVDPAMQDCGFEGYNCSEACPGFCQFNGFGNDCVCADPLPATINGGPCIVGTERWSWGRVKITYR